MLHSTVAWIVRWRSGMSRDGRHEEREHLVEPSEHHGGRQRADAGGGELDRERHALERAADARDAVGVLVGHLEARVGRPRAVDGTAAPRRRSEIASSGGARGVGRQRERLARRTRARRGSAAVPGSSRGTSRRAGRAAARTTSGAAGEDLLEVVEHDEVAAAGARDAELLAERPVAGVAHAELARDRRAARRPGRDVLERRRTSPGRTAPRRSLATSMASRLLPMPPGPTSVTTPPSRRRRASRAASRPRARGRPPRCTATGMRVAAAGVLGDVRVAGARDASNRSASRVARSASIELGELLRRGERRVRTRCRRCGCASSSSTRRSSRSAGCFR